ncbi:MAG: sigma-70 family RNA polymerase sigma factor [Bacteroidota bacterium]
MTKKRENKITSVIREYNRRLFRFIRSRVPSNADAEDILQDVWFQFSKVVDIDSIEQVSGWLFRVARNRVTDSYRKKTAGSLEDQSFEDGDDLLEFRDLLMADSSSPEMENLKEIFWETLFEALDELPEAQRNAFVWNELEDQTFQEIADRTGESIKTWISRKRYAVKHLRGRLEGLYRAFLEE